ncbi:DUF6912 family protein [Fodinicola feengrottensis]|uniref:Uncharacterized protein n=1 Tax=Fodinicola feengrottensis TaxID=435914 RepID=A0ABP4TE15_9ACTN|nr:hypothetical protein [Fodinicola feengrottensis]
MRVYLPATLPALRTLKESGEIPLPITAFAVTAALREWYVDDDGEELEYAAFTEAARASLRMIDRDPTAPRRRVVISADVDDAAAKPRPDLDRAVVRLADPVVFAAVAAIHVDGVAAVDDVRAAANVVIEADLGDEDSQFTVDSAEGHELEWYDVTEIDDLLK